MIVYKTNAVIIKVIARLLSITVVTKSRSRNSVSIKLPSDLSSSKHSYVNEMAANGHCKSFIISGQSFELNLINLLWLFCLFYLKQYFISEKLTSADGHKLIPPNLSDNSQIMFGKEDG